VRVDAEMELGDESVAKILGGEIVQRCGCHDASSDRGDVVSLFVDLLHELRQRRPVFLTEESFIDLARQSRPPLLPSDYLVQAVEIAPAPSSVSGHLSGGEDGFPGGQCGSER
jgi:hypothetical protein